MARDNESLKALAAECGIEYREHIDQQIDPAVLALLSRDIARRYCTIPLAREVSGSRIIIKVAISNPLDVDTVDTLRYLTERDVEPVIVPKPEIERAYMRFYALP